MSAFVCENCGAGLRLSLTDRAYLCEASPREHRFDRGECEQSWLRDASARVEACPDDVDEVFQLASLCGRLASTSLRAGDPDPARFYMGQVVKVVEVLHEARQGDERARAMMMEALVEQATVGEKIKDLGMAATAYERLVPLAEADAQAQPKSIEAQRNLSVCLNGAGRMLRALGNAVQARQFFARDLEVIEHLEELYPDDVGLRLDHAVAHFNMFLVSDVREEETGRLEAVIEILSALPPSEMKDQARSLEQRAKAELERVRCSEPTAPSKLAQATAEVLRGKNDDARVDAKDGRAWLIEQVEGVLGSRRKRLPVVR